MCGIFQYRKKMSNVCIFSHDQVTYDIATIHSSSSYRYILVWADIRLTVKTTDPANTEHSTKAGSMLGQRRRRWANIASTFGCVESGGGGRCFRQIL